MKTYSTIIIFLFLLISGSAFAQNGDNKQKFRDEIDRIIKTRLIDSVGLDANTADKFFKIYKENNKQIRTLSKEKREIMKSIESNPEASDVESKLDRMYEIETKISEQRKNFITELKGILTSQQIAKAIVLKKNLMKEFKKQIQNRKRTKEE